jgi:hypothetical protein
MIQTNITEEKIQTEFVALLPRILPQLKKGCRIVRCAASRDDFIAEALGLCWKMFRRAMAKGKDVASFIITMAKYAARAVRCGRTVCGQQKAKDVLSLTAKLTHGVVVEQFGSGSSHYEELYGEVDGQKRRDLLDEVLAENIVTAVPDQVAFRIDWPRFMASRPERDQKIMAYLANGSTNLEAAKKFNVSPGRVSQLRRAWCEEWQMFCE